jgi:hypothetical protein
MYETGAGYGGPEPGSKAVEWDWRDENEIPYGAIGCFVNKSSIVGAVILEESSEKTFEFRNVAGSVGAKKVVKSMNSF